MPLLEELIATFGAVAIKILLLRSISCLNRRFKLPQAETKNRACSGLLVLGIGQTPAAAIFYRRTANLPLAAVRGRAGGALPLPEE
jgi:hypothetical protein